MAFITARANALIEKYPEKRTIFEGYIISQQNEYDDIENSLVGATWILEKHSQSAHRLPIAKQCA